MIFQTKQALLLSNLSLMVIDAKVGVTRVDAELGKFMRKTQSENADCKDIILVANKSEGSFPDITSEALKLGLGKPIYISAQHNEGMADLYESIRQRIPLEYFETYRTRLESRRRKHQEIKAANLAELQALEAASSEEFDLKEWSKEYDRFNDPEMSDYDSDNDLDLKQSLTTDLTDSKVAVDDFRRRKAIQMSVLGLPNSGKSTLINRLIKEDRVIVDSEPGTTRDAIYIEHIHKVTAM
jgi:GTP-binding protein